MIVLLVHSCNYYLLLLTFKIFSNLFIFRFDEFEKLVKGGNGFGNDDDDYAIG